MPDLSPLTPLGAGTPQRLALSTLTISEMPDHPLISMALPRNVKPVSLRGLDLPGPGDWAEAGGLGAVWIAPNQWLIEDRGDGGQDLAAIVRDLVPGAAVTDQTDGWVSFAIASTAGEAPILTLAEKLVNLDPARFAPGHGIRTLMHHMTVVLIRRAEDRLAILGPRSFAGSLWHALTQAARRQDAPG